MKKCSFFLRCFLLFFCCVVLSPPCFSQFVTGIDRVQLPSPQDWDFVRYGKVPVNPYTGTLSLTIPIYQYTDPDFDISIAAGYVAEGFKPNQLAGVLGLGWHLHAGGCVTREVRGVSDGFSGSGLYTPRIRGYAHYRNSGYTDHLDTALDGYGSTSTPFLYQHGNNSYETHSDIYHFSFGSHKGSFVLGTDRQTYVFGSDAPSGEYQISLSVHPDSSEILRIVIKTGDGYTYIFGDSPALRRHSTSNVPQTLAGYAGTGIIDETPRLSWPLTEILSPNGRSIVFEYLEAQLYSFCRPEIWDLNMWDNEYDNLSPSYSYHLPILVTKLPGSQDTQSTWCSLLKQIRIDDDIQIHFTYEARSSPERYSYLDHHGTLRTGALTTSPLLREIRVQPSASPSGALKTCRLVYRYASGDNPVLFLDSITLSGEGSYTMDYYDATNFPNQGSVSADLWGFYTNMASSGPKSTYTLPRSPDLARTRKGMLSSLIWPTGGSTSFEYELHRCSHTLARSQSSPGFPFFLACDEQAVGGLRIQKITDHATSGQESASREFMYESGGKSTGVSLNFPFYLLPPPTPHSRASADPAYGSKPPPIEEVYRKEYSPDKSHIEYTSVKEKHADGAVVEYTYSHYGNMPDVPLLTRCIPLAGTSLPWDYQRKPFFRHNQRGRLLNKKFYDASGTLLRKESHVYDTAAPLPFIAGLEVDKDALYVFHTYVGDYPLIRSIETDYTGSDSIETVSEFRYNFRHQLVRSSSANSDGTVQTVETTYLPAFEETVPGTLFYNMVGLGFTAFPLQREVFRHAPGEPLRRLFQERTVYLQIDNFFKPDTVFRTFGEGGSALSRACRFTYNRSGNVIETVSPAGRITSYVWGYDGLLLLAQVENAGIRTVMEHAFPTLPLRVHPLSGSLSDAQKAAVRNIPGALSTLFDYKPFVGVSRIDPPDGNSTRYSYDAFGRLRGVFDSQGSPIRQVDYFIKTQ